MAGRTALVAWVALLTVTWTIPAAAVAQAGSQPVDEALASLSELDHRGSLSAAHGDPLPAPPAFQGGAEALATLAGDDLDREQADRVLAEAPAELRPALERLFVGLAQAQLLVDRGIAEAGLASLTVDEVHDRVAGGQGWTGIAHHAGEPDPSMGLGEAPAPDRQLPPVPEGPFLAAQAALTESLLAAEAQLSKASLAASSQAQAPGDIVDQRPFLIVSGEGDHHYEPGDDAMVIVDLAGDESYENAQGSPFDRIPGYPVPGARAGLPQVLVDLDGDDRYTHDYTSGNIRPSSDTQGAGHLGVGGLVDAGGQDRFDAKAEHGRGPVATTLTAQGAGLLGVGALLVLGGQACLQAEAIGQGRSTDAYAQGAGVLGAGAAVVQAEPGPGCEDNLVAEATAEPYVPYYTSPGMYEAELGPAQVVAQGAAQGGGAGTFVGSVHDDGYRAAARGGAATTFSQGASGLGVGLLVDPAGDDDHASTARSQGDAEVAISGSSVSAQAAVEVGSSQAIAQGATGLGQAGLLDAGPGGDRFAVTAQTEAIAEALAEGRSSASAEASVDVGDTYAVGHGAGNLGTAVHASASTSEAVSEATDERVLSTELVAQANATAEGDGTNEALATTETGDAVATGLGRGLLGAGVHADAGGADGYRMQASLDADANATAKPSGTITETLTSGEERTEGLGEDGFGGLGLFVDADGEDSYGTDPGPTQAGDDRCWPDKSPPLDGGLGIDVGTGVPSPDCAPS